MTTSYKSQSQSYAPTFSGYPERFVLGSSLHIALASVARVQPRTSKGITDLL